MAWFDSDRPVQVDAQGRYVPPPGAVGMDWNTKGGGDQLTNLQARNIKISDDLWRRVRVAAAEADLTIQEYVAAALEEKIRGARETAKHPRGGVRVQDRYQREQDAYEGYVGSQSVSEFMEISQREGHRTIPEAAEAYVQELREHPPFEGGIAEDIPEDLEELLAGYIERVLPLCRVCSHAGLITWADADGDLCHTCAEETRKARKSGAIE